MRLKCPNCKAQYEVSDDVIPDAGRDVQCSNCGHTWFQGPDALAHLDDDDELDTEEGEAAAGEDLDVSEEEPVTEVEETLETVEEIEPLPEVIRPAPKRRELPDEIASVLREEAEFDVQARAAEPEPLETQPDLGIEEEATDSKAAATPVLGAAIATGLSAATQTDELPNVETINSTLTADANTSATEAAAGHGFRNGFLSMMFLGIVALAVYVYAPQIADGVPALAGPLTEYAEKIDAFRLWIDGALQGSATS